MMNTPVNICIVDDDDIYQFTVVKTLELLEFEKNIKVFSDGEEALEFLLSNLNQNDELPDVIFLDINMPIMDGYQFMEEYVKIKSKLGKKTVIYMVSSSVDPVDIEKAKRISDISDYIIKPIEPGKLKSIMEQLIKESN
ncbi:two-component response regulator [Algibacter lectus]|uniref:Response regulator receiver domain-containing protein n=2 Tax=Flavobacteriaceae TaxID=49546 RepID=A0A090V8H8_9FLAO|nr:response regulator receiver domain-containing protein [Algibacter lectus]GAL61175.1 two-component response regulator [Algibacter lectus]GAL80060.1 two-component response regulator [Algibacter lectus]SFD47240.1 Response regulator receiver domain-containing protein [Algibacter lectus]